MYHFEKKKTREGKRKIREEKLYLYRKNVRESKINRQLGKCKWYEWRTFSVLLRNSGYPDSDEEETRNKNERKKDKEKTAQRFPRVFI